MIKNKLMVLLAERELHLTDLAEETGIRYATLWNFAKNKTQAAGYNMLDRICIALDCEVGDILQHIPPGKKATKGKTSR